MMAVSIRACLLSLVSVMFSAVKVRAESPAIRSGTGWAIHAQREPGDWTKLIAGGNLIAKKMVTSEAAPNDHNTGSELLHLTDGVLAGADGRMWSDKQATIFADLGATQPIDSVVIRLLGGAAQNAPEFPDEIRVLLSDDGLEYHLAASRHKRGLDDLSADSYSLPEEKIAWVHNFRLPVKQKARHVAVQVLHTKQYIVSDELAVVKGADSLPAFQPKSDTRVALVTDGVAFMPVWGNVQPICQNLPLRSRLEKQDARSGDKFDKPCKILLDLPETLKFATAGITPTEVKHDGRTFRRYTINWAGEGTDFLLQSLLPAGEVDVLYTSGDSGNGPENERRIAWKSLFIPPARVPKRLHVSLSWAESVRLYKTWPDYLQAQRHLGFNAIGTMPCYWQKKDIPEYQTTLKEIRRQGFQIVQIESSAGALEVDRKQQETLSIFADGIFTDICPAYRGQFYKKEHTPASGKAPSGFSPTSSSTTSRRTGAERQIPLCVSAAENGSSPASSKTGTPTAPRWAARFIST